MKTRNVTAIAWLALVPLLTGCATSQSFSSSDQAVDSLVSAIRDNNQQQMKKILGPGSENVFSSGDAVADQNGREKFLAAYDQKHRLDTAANGTVTLIVGDDEWPMPIPIIKNPDKNAWSFDLAAGKDEILNRRIGRNELDTIQTCLAIVDAEREYSDADPEHVGKPIYAQKFLSDPGRKNGLYWETKDGEPASPLGNGIADAAKQGYTFTAGQPAPYHGYFYRILTAQGASAPGGAHDDIENGKLVNGFAVIAYPSEYGNSGVTSFIVNQTGIVYSCDLGADTMKIASQMTAFDPTSPWQPVPDANVVIGKP
jgi:Protein of unknown function (DUF2950)